MSHKKRLKMANPNKMYHAPDGTVVQGNAVVEFATPIHPDVQLKIARGFLVETDEDVADNTYRNTGNLPATTEARWLTKKPPHQKIYEAPAPTTMSSGLPRGPRLPTPGVVPTPDSDTAQHKHELAELRKQVREASEKTNSDLDSKLDELRSELGPMLELFNEHGEALVAVLPALGPLATYIEKHGDQLAALVADEGAEVEEADKADATGKPKTTRGTKNSEGA